MSPTELASVDVSDSPKWACSGSDEQLSSALVQTRRCGSGNAFLYFLVGVAAIGGLLFGYDTGVVSGAMILIRKDFDLVDWQHEMVVSSTVLFAAIGAAVSGPPSRAYGRRPVLLFAAAVFTAGAGIMAVAGSFGVLLIGRMVVGVGVGIASAIVPTFIAELAPPHMRGFLVSLNNVCVVSGQVLAALVDGAFGGVPEGWRCVANLGGCVVSVHRGR